jgi:hypothetical protein
MEAVVDGDVIGWAWSPPYPSVRVLVAIAVDGVEVARGVANAYRASLAESGIGDGSYVFRIALPAAIADSAKHRIAALAAAAGVTLTPSAEFQVKNGRVDGPFAGTSFVPAR